MSKRDIIVIGASAGGIEALTALVPDFPEDLGASVFVVVHIPSTAPSMLPRILTRRGRLPAVHPRNGERVERGTIYVAPPGKHLLLEKGRIRLIRGPIEHGVRPAVDPLFRSAALAYGPRVIGVILSGNLDDGTAGVEAIKSAGGVTIAQDPHDALYPGMINSAVESGYVDQILSLAQIPSTLVELSGSIPGERSDMGQRAKEEEERKELAIDELQVAQLEGDDQPGEVSGFTCPNCHGALWELAESDTLRFRCRVGHAFAVESLLAEQADSIEAAFWIALRALEERAALLRRLTQRAEKKGNTRSAERYTVEEDVVAKRARTLRDVILNGILTNEVESRQA